MSDDNRRFDPTRAELGVWSRTKYGHSPKRMDEYTGFNDDINFDPYNYEPEQDDMQKGAAQATDLFDVPDDGRPNFPEPKPGGVYTEPGFDAETDLEVHGSHEEHKTTLTPSTKDLIRSRIRNLRKANSDQKSEKKVLEEAVEEQDQKFKLNQEAPTDVKVDRRNQDPRGFSLMGKRASVGVLSDDDVNPITLMLHLDEMWSEEEEEEDWRQWEPETIIETAKAEGFDISRANMDKIMALKVLSKNDEFFEDPRVFEKVCMAFSGRIVDWGNIQHPRVHEICGCIALVERYIKERQYSDDVAAYVAATAVRDGFIMLPPILNFASYPFLQELVINMGDAALEKQEKLRLALEEQDASILNSEEAVQYMRVLRTQYHVSEVIDGVRG